MISRREVVTAGVLGTLSAGAGAGAAPEAAQSDQADAVTRSALRDLRAEMQQLRAVLDSGLRGPSLSFGSIADIRERLTIYLRSSGKFPDFMEIGTSPFYDVYDWHVKHSQAIQITRLADQRMAIQFMFTQLIVRWEQDRNFLGQPYDRG
jgi:hypothetical protein